MRISVITPWLDHAELMEDYEATVAAPGVEVVVVDNGSTPEKAAALDAMVLRLGGRCLRNGTNRWFAAANNQGFAAPRGDVVVFLNTASADGVGARPQGPKYVVQDAPVGRGLSAQFGHPLLQDPREGRFGARPDVRSPCTT
jgi:hypothetical protein